MYLSSANSTQTCILKFSPVKLVFWSSSANSTQNEDQEMYNTNQHTGKKIVIEWLSKWPELQLTVYIHDFWKR